LLRRALDADFWGRHAKTTTLLVEAGALVNAMDQFPHVREGSLEAVSGALPPEIFEVDSSG
jgi:hypothetical protein